MMSDNKPLILAVDDKPQILTSIADMLKEEYDVICVTSAIAALKAIEKHMPRLFLLDIEMPQVNGYQLAKTIRSNKKFGKTPIIFLTGKNTAEHVITAVKTGGNDYLLKPVEKSVLLEKMRKFIG